MLDEILQILKSDVRKLVLLHHNADLDALGSALALYYSFPHITIGAPDNLGRTAKHLQRSAGVDIVIEPRAQDFEKVIVVDTPAIERLGLDIASLGDRLVVIDHHETSAHLPVRLYYSDPKKKSCAEIIHEILKLGSVPLKRETALALTAGIITDTAHFRHANVSTLKTTVSILEESGIDLDHAMSSIVNDPEDISEKIAVLKGLQRMRFERVRTWLILGTTVNAHEALVCNAMLAAGGDVSFVAAQRDGEARVSGRARSHCVRFGFSLGALFQELGRELGTEGGGHPGAGGIGYSGDAEALLNMCIEKAIKWAEPRLRDADLRQDRYSHNLDSEKPGQQSSFDGSLHGWGGNHDTGHQNTYDNRQYHHDFDGGRGGH